jgi:hypothetical protein
MINIMTKLLMVFAKLTQISHKPCLDWSTNSICLYYHLIEFSKIAFKTLSSPFPFLITLTLPFLEAWFRNGFKFTSGALSKVIHPAFISYKSFFYMLNIHQYYGLQYQNGILNFDQAYTTM